MRVLIISLRSIALIIVLAYAGACRKDFKSNDQSSPPNTGVVGEQAYPGMQGELLTTQFNNKKIFVEHKGGRYVWMGDIAFDQATFDSLNQAAASPLARTFKPDVFRQWKNGKVYYQINAGFTADEISRINAAIDHWRNATGLTFTERTFTFQSNYIQFVRGRIGSGIYSDYIGMKGGVQTINFESFFNSGDAIHEIGHAIGFYHEQCRTDRGNAIIVYYDRVTPHTNQVIYQYLTYAEMGESGAQIGAFDFNSVMLYGSFHNSTNHLPVMTRLDGSTFAVQRDGLSAGDIETANFMYGPPFARIEYDNVYYNNFSTQDYEYINSMDDIRIKLYADRQCTIPFTTMVPFTFTYNLLVSEMTSQWAYTTTSVIPAGSSTAYLDYHVVTQDFYVESGNVITNNGRGYIGLNGFFRL